MILNRIRLGFVQFDYAFRLLFRLLLIGNNKKEVDMLFFYFVIDGSIRGSI